MNPAPVTGNLFNLCDKDASAVEADRCFRYSLDDGKFYTDENPAIALPLEFVWSAASLDWASGHSFRLDVSKDLPTGGMRYAVFVDGVNVASVTDTTAAVCYSGNRSVSFAVPVEVAVDEIRLTDRPNTFGNLVGQWLFNGNGVDAVEVNGSRHFDFTASSPVYIDIVSEPEACSKCPLDCSTGTPMCSKLPPAVVDKSITSAAGSVTIQSSAPANGFTSVYTSADAAYTGYINQKGMHVTLAAGANTNLVGANAFEFCDHNNGGVQYCIGLNENALFMTVAGQSFSTPYDRTTETPWVPMTYGMGVESGPGWPCWHYYFIVNGNIINAQNSCTANQPGFTTSFLTLQVHDTIVVDSVRLTTQYPYNGIVAAHFDFKAGGADSRSSGMVFDLASSPSLVVLPTLYSEPVCQKVECPDLSFDKTRCHAQNGCLWTGSACATRACTSIQYTDRYLVSPTPIVLTSTAPTLGSFTSQTCQLSGETYPQMTTRSMSVTLAPMSNIRSYTSSVFRLCEQMMANGPIDFCFDLTDAGGGGFLTYRTNALVAYDRSTLDPSVPHTFFTGIARDATDQWTQRWYVDGTEVASTTLNSGGGGMYCAPVYGNVVGMSMFLNANVPVSAIQFGKYHTPASPDVVSAYDFSGTGVDLFGTGRDILIPVTMQSVLSDPALPATLFSSVNALSASFAPTVSSIFFPANCYQTHPTMGNSFASMSMEVVLGPMSVLPATAGNTWFTLTIQMDPLQYTFQFINGDLQVILWDGVTRSLQAPIQMNTLDWTKPHVFTLSLSRTTVNAVDVVIAVDGVTYPAASTFIDVTGVVMGCAPYFGSTSFALYLAPSVSVDRFALYRGSLAAGNAVQSALWSFNGDGSEYLGSGCDFALPASPVFTALYNNTGIFSTRPIQNVAFHPLPPRAETFEDYSTYYTSFSVNNLNMTLGVNSLVLSESSPFYSDSLFSSATTNYRITKPSLIPINDPVQLGAFAPVTVYYGVPQLVELPVSDPNSPLTPQGVLDIVQLATTCPAACPDASLGSAACLAVDTCSWTDGWIHSAMSVGQNFGPHVLAASGPLPASGCHGGMNGAGQRESLVISTDFTVPAGSTQNSDKVWRFGVSDTATSTFRGVEIDLSIALQGRARWYDNALVGEAPVSWSFLADGRHHEVVASALGNPGVSMTYSITVDGLVLYLHTVYGLDSIAPCSDLPALVVGSQVRVDYFRLSNGAAVDTGYWPFNADLVDTVNGIVLSETFAAIVADAQTDMCAPPVLCTGTNIDPTVFAGQTTIQLEALVPFATTVVVYTVTDNDPEVPSSVSGEFNVFVPWVEPFDVQQSGMIGCTYVVPGTGPEASPTCRAVVDSTSSVELIYDLAQLSVVSPGGLNLVEITGFTAVGTPLATITYDTQSLHVVTNGDELLDITVHLRSTLSAQVADVQVYYDIVAGTVGVLTAVPDQIVYLDGLDRVLRILPDYITDPDDPATPAGQHAVTSALSANPAVCTATTDGQNITMTPIAAGDCTVNFVVSDNYGDLTGAVVYSLFTAMEPLVITTTIDVLQSHPITLVGTDFVAPIVDGPAATVSNPRIECADCASDCDPLVCAAGAPCTSTCSSATLSAGLVLEMSTEGTGYAVFDLVRSTQTITIRVPFAAHTIGPVCYVGSPFFPTIASIQAEPLCLSIGVAPGNHTLTGVDASSITELDGSGGRLVLVGPLDFSSPSVNLSNIHFEGPVTFSGITANLVNLQFEAGASSPSTCPFTPLKLDERTHGGPIAIPGCAVGDFKEVTLAMKLSGPSTNEYAEAYIDDMYFWWNGDGSFGCNAGANAQLNLNAAVPAYDSNIPIWVGCRFQADGTLTALASYTHFGAGETVYASAPVSTGRLRKRCLIAGVDLKAFDGVAWGPSPVIDGVRILSDGNTLLAEWDFAVGAAAIFGGAEHSFQSPCESSDDTLTGWSFDLANPVVTSIGGPIEKPACTADNVGNRNSGIQMSGYGTMDALSNNKPVRMRAGQSELEFRADGRVACRLFDNANTLLGEMVSPNPWENLSGTDANYDCFYSDASPTTMYLTLRILDTNENAASFTASVVVSGEVTVPAEVWPCNLEYIELSMPNGANPNFEISNIRALEGGATPVVVANPPALPSSDPAYQAWQTTSVTSAGQIDMSFSTGPTQPKAPQTNELTFFVMPVTQIPAISTPSGGGGGGICLDATGIIDHSYTGCSFVSCGMRIVGVGSAAVVDSTTFTNVPGAAIDISSVTSVQVTNNQFIDCGADDHAVRISAHVTAVQPFVEKIEVTGNVHTMSLPQSGDFAAYYFHDLPDVIDLWKVQNNAASGAAYGMQLDATVTLSTILSNQVIDPTIRAVDSKEALRELALEGNNQVQGTIHDMYQDPEFCDDLCVPVEIAPVDPTVNVDWRASPYIYVPGAGKALSFTGTETATLNVQPCSSNRPCGYLSSDLQAAFTVEVNAQATAPGGILVGNDVFELYLSGYFVSAKVYIGGSPVNIVSTFALAPGANYHVTARFNGSVLEVLVDAAVVGSVAASGSMDLATAPMVIGSGFIGIIDELRIWSLDRTNSELSAYRLRTLAGSLPGLMSYHRFDEDPALHWDPLWDITDHRVDITTGAVLVDSPTAMSLNVFRLSLAVNHVSDQAATVALFPYQTIRTSSDCSTRPRLLDALGDPDVTGYPWGPIFLPHSPEFVGLENLLYPEHVWSGRVESVTVMPGSGQPAEPATLYSVDVTLQELLACKEGGISAMEHPIPDKYTGKMYFSGTQAINLASELEGEVVRRGGDYPFSIKVLSDFGTTVAFTTSAFQFNMELVRVWFDVSGELHVILGVYFNTDAASELHDALVLIPGETGPSMTFVQSGPLACSAPIIDQAYLDTFYRDVVDPRWSSGGSILSSNCPGQQNERHLRVPNNADLVLSLSNLPPHTRASVSMDIIGVGAGWLGDSKSEFVRVGVDGQSAPLVFSTLTTSNAQTDGLPGTHTFSALCGQDVSVPFSTTISHSTSGLNLRLRSIISAASPSQYFAIDNLVITVFTPTGEGICYNEFELVTSGESATTDFRGVHPVQFTPYWFDPNLGVMVRRGNDTLLSGTVVLDVQRADAPVVEAPSNAAAETHIYRDTDLVNECGSFVDNERAYTRTSMILADRGSVQISRLLKRAGIPMTGHILPYDRLNPGSTGLNTPNVGLVEGSNLFTLYGAGADPDFDWQTVARGPCAEFSSELCDSFLVRKLVGSSTRTVYLEDRFNMTVTPPVYFTLIGDPEAVQAPGTVLTLLGDGSIAGIQTCIQGVCANIVSAALPSGAAYTGDMTIQPDGSVLSATAYELSFAIDQPLVMPQALSVNRAIKLSGDAGAYAEILYTLPADLYESTLEFFVRLAAAPAVGDDYPLVQITGDVDMGCGILSKTMVCWRALGANQARTVVSLQGLDLVSELTHVAQVFSVRGSQLIISIYINGVPIAVQSRVMVGSTGAAYAIPAGQVQTLRVTAPQNVIYDEQRLWSAARTEQQIKENSDNLITSPGSEATLVSYHKFDDGTSDYLQDSAGAYGGNLINLSGDLSKAVKTAQVHHRPGFYGYGATTLAADVPAAFLGNVALELKAGSAVSASFVGHNSADFTLSMSLSSNAAVSAPVKVAEWKDAASSGVVQVYLSSTDIEVRKYGPGAALEAQSSCAAPITEMQSTLQAFSFRFRKIAVGPDMSGFDIFVNGVKQSATVVASIASSAATKFLPTKSYVLTLNGDVAENIYFDEVQLWSIPSSDNDILIRSSRTVMPSEPYLLHYWSFQASANDLVGTAHLGLSGQAAMAPRNMRAEFSSYDFWSAGALPSFFAPRPSFSQIVGYVTSESSGMSLTTMQVTCYDTCAGVDPWHSTSTSWDWSGSGTTGAWCGAAGLVIIIIIIVVCLCYCRSHGHAHGVGLPTYAAVATVADEDTYMRRRIMVRATEGEYF